MLFLDNVKKKSLSTIDIYIGHSDIAYEWYLRKSGHNIINVLGKFCNEGGGYQGEFYDDRRI
ncbi:hypothetical protein PIROE2DRAFT_1649 [Piromyces sp. E2]|nr:hypothetical protein PIROE2DRAFT_1649 [Piromyces sp. E2]|eukprot:OUM70237.1 hypothetical protein PIROE2DRAFT_1649 [Piromyces sp. E2]